MLRGRAGVEMRELLTLAWPVVLSRLGVMAMGLSNAVVVGRYSGRELGYHAIAWAPSSVAITASIGLLMGVQVMTARAIGEGRREEVGAVLRRGVVYAFWIGLASSVLLGVGGPPALRLMGLDADLAEGAARTTVIFSLSLTAHVLACAFSFWLEGLSRPVPAMVIMWAANLVNLLLLLWLVPGAPGVPIDGAAAGALATGGARVVLLLGLAIYVLRMKESRALGVFRKAPREPHLEAQQRRIGYGAGASNFFEVAAFSALAILAGWVSPPAVAAWAVVLSVSGLVFMPQMGVATATAVLVGRAYGAGDREAVVRVGVLGFGVTALNTLALSLIIWPAAGLVVAAYTQDAAVMAIATPALIVACLYFVTDGLQVVVAHALRARADVLMPSVTHLVSYVVVMMPLAWWLGIALKLEVIGLVWAVNIASLLSAGLLLGRFAMLNASPVVTRIEATVRA
ncbi:MAG: MATE family efflux transporter [Phenylobacterium sp.]|uniref:MATE family efflux transporter n=1 Tax=Phenylobacterium sp. TaxID=1871053 RepID=UPI002734506F|nr:MATE family efflux transporter [Phenylobacterium sp.]MDP3175439.1 MATE family efflux transporter [Phenylobacterium sp.]